MKKLLTLVSSLLLFMQLFNITAFAADNNILKNETVYVNLNHNGSVINKSVVNWIHSEGNVPRIVDYGKYKSVRNMTSNIYPEIYDGKIIWPIDLAKGKDIYYEGNTDKGLPLDINITYFLDGKEQNAENLAGKSGNVRIEIKMVNNLKQNSNIYYKTHNGKTKYKLDEHYIPLAVQVLIKADVNKFSNISAKNSGQVLIGNTMDISLISFPYPEDTLVLDMYGNNIELEPINITIMPQAPPSINIDFADNLNGFSDGIDKMQYGLDGIMEGSDKLSYGVQQFKNGGDTLNNILYQVTGGMEKINSSSSVIGSGFAKLDAGLNDFKKQIGVFSTININELLNNTNDINKGIEGVNKGANDLYNGISNIDNNMEALKSSHDSLSELAKALSSSPDPNVAALANGILAEKEAINGIYYGITNVKDGSLNLSEGTDKLSSGFNDYNQGLNNLSSELKISSEDVNSIDKIIDGQRELNQGWNEYSIGVEKVSAALPNINKGIESFLLSSEEIISGHVSLKEGIDNINKNGFTPMKEKINEGIDGINFGIAKKNKVSELANEYKSFMDNANNTNSKVQFIMQTKEIKIPKKEIVKTAAIKEKSSIVERFIQLFHSLLH